MKTQKLLKILPMVWILGTASGQAAAERLELGIQLQTADGNLNAAIAEYRIVLKMADVGNHLAAEALYRLAECILKLKNEKGMTEQLAALREKFPGDNPWVIKAADLTPVEISFHGTPWVDASLQTYEIKLPNGQVVGHFMVTTRPVKVGPDEAWETISVRTAGGASLSRSRFLVEGYRPLESRWYLDAFGDLGITFNDQDVVTIRDIEIGKIRDTYDHSASGKRATALFKMSR